MTQLAQPPRSGASAQCCAGRAPGPAGAAGAGPGRQHWRGRLVGTWTGLSLGLLLLPGCVTTVVDDNPLTGATTDPVVIELPNAATSPDDVAVQQFYESILARLHAAHRERDLETMHALIGGYLRDEAPAWARQRLLGFRALAAGLQFEQFVARSARIATSTPAPAEGTAAAADVESVGTPMQVELELPTMPGTMVRLGGRDDDDPVAFQVVIRVTDQFLDGSTREHRDSDILRLPVGVALDTAPVQLPVRIDLGSGDAVRRVTDVRIDLLPGYVHVGDDRAPVRRTTLAATTLTQWAAGHREIRQAPLASLRAAQQQGDPASWPRIRLAAEFASAAERADVEALLIDWVRLGTPQQAIVAMATLRAIGCAQNPVGDRDGWLAWWQSHR